MHKLHIVATPIGNLQDVSLRALAVLDEVGLIAAEDTRVTRRLLSRHGISTKLTSYHQHSPPARLQALLAALQEGDVALVCDAGTPGINDAAVELVRAAANAGVEVVAVPGPSSVTAAISLSGLDMAGFVYLGFLPRARPERKRLLAERVVEPLALVALETPHRLRAALADMLEVLGDRDISVCRELTKVHEEVFRGLISGAIEHFAEPRGEFTLVVAGAAELQVDPIALEAEAQAMLAELRQAGSTGRDAVAEVTHITGLSKRHVYEMWRGGDTISPE
jgi:16S rRNA (cytidine1402-2'-O)-methyltransferase